MKRAAATFSRRAGFSPGTWSIVFLLIACCSAPVALFADQDEREEAPTSAPEGASVDTAAISSTGEALAVGNRLFEEGRYEEALLAYTRGFEPAMPHPTLVYNTAATLHRLDRLPEAILWYLRSDSNDPWVQENLWLARRSLGSQQIPANSWAHRLAEHTGALAIGSILVAWLTLVLVAMDSKLGLRPVAVLCLVAVALYGLGAVAELEAPRAAVLLEDCPATVGPIPAGTEVWVRSADEGYRILGTTDPVTCPGTSIGLVSPEV